MNNSARAAEKEPLMLGQPLLNSSYGSTSFFENMDDQRGNSEQNSSYAQSPGEAMSRRISASEIYIPRSRWSWKENLKNWSEFKFRRASPHSNRISTTKYTLLTFIPKNLFEQFHRLANVYFLVLIGLNFIPAIEVFGKEVSWVPLTVILLAIALKDGLEDYRRYRSDKRLNALPCCVYDSKLSRFVQKTWRDVYVGNLIKLNCDDVIPADLLLLWSSDTDDLCYIQTSNLDGETNLKQRQVPVGVLERDHQLSDQSLDQDQLNNFNSKSFSGRVYCEPPNQNVYRFKGYSENSNGSTVSLSHQHLLLRGCILRNTNCVLGVVVYAGHETKALLNNSGTKSKRSKLEKDINKDVIFQLVLLFALCFIGATMSGIWTGEHINRNIVFFPFTSGNANPALEGFIRFWSYVIILQVIVPISLYVTVEIVKFAQIFFLNWDLDMYYEKYDKPFECKALNISEDLGQIKYVFSDKTGTLTENEMVYKCCSIGGTNYLHSLTPDDKPYTNTLHVPEEETDYPSPSPQPVSVDKQLLGCVNNPKSLDSVVHDFMITMAICNTVVVSRQANSNSPGNGNMESGNVYEAESPDEYALVEGACAYGYVLLSRSPTLIRLKTPHHGTMEFEPLNVLEFNSDRKRMSVIVRDKSTGVITLYCKGADSIIFSRLSASHHADIQNRTQEHLDYYARLGLRILCLSKRVLSEEDYKEWLVDYKKAEYDLINREERMFECASDIEKHLELLGATGIEDKLQDGVKDTISSLRKAGMKIWVLTGDKTETAINVGYASGLLSENTEIIHLKAKSEEECLDRLRTFVEQMFPSLQDLLKTTDISESFIMSKTPVIRLRSALSWSGSSTKKQSLIPNHKLRALIVDGTTLGFAFKPSCRALFTAIGKECHSVVCCRATPIQKAQVVELVKESSSDLTLAIGDGANDVSMIQMANVGIGIAGREGMQAVLASDFNMGRFKFLKRLLLVHGHWCYSRLANMMLYFFYKNILYAMVIFWFQLFNGFSGSNPIDGINLQIFNLVYTALPIMVAAVGDQDVKSEELLRNQTHYQQGQQSKVYTRIKFYLIVLEALYQSVTVFFVAYAAYYDSTLGIVEFGFVINFSAVIVASIHMALEFLHWTFIHHFFLWGSMLLLFVFNYVYCAIDSQQRIMDTYFIIQVLSGDARFWFVLLITPIIALFPRVVGKSFNQDLFPNSVLRARAEEKKTRKILIHDDSIEPTNRTVKS